MLMCSSNSIAAVTSKTGISVTTHVQQRKVTNSEIIERWHNTYPEHPPNESHSTFSVNFL